MTLRNLFVLNAVVALAFAAGFLVIPGTLWTLYGLTPDAEVNLVGQYFAVELVAVGLVSWLVRNVVDVAVLRGITLGLLISDTIGLVLSLYAIFSGLFGAFGWSAVVVYLFFALGYGYFRFVRLEGGATAQDRAVSG